MSAVDYDSLIPNNVDLSSDKRLKRALEQWHPKFINWWLSAGPVAHKDNEVFLRTAVGVDREGWAKFGYVKMPEYRWGILLAPAEEGRTIPFGEHKGEPVWQEVPGEYRAMLKRLLIIQGDTEPASVEQQRYLSHTAPSLYDMRNLFQVNVEEGRHLWAMVYLLQKYFGRDGREEAEMLLNRRSGDEDTPRILGAFNEKTPDWLSFFMFTSFTDRDGKMQLESLSQSGFDPLSRTCRFMLTEEGHHMYVGKSGVDRVIEKTCSEMTAHGISDVNDIEAVRKLGVIDLPTIQKKINFHLSVTLDLFGSELSTNAANSFNAGLKGRFGELKLEDDHQLHSDTYAVTQWRDGTFQKVEHPALNAINARLSDDYIQDCQTVLKAWQKTVDKSGIQFTLSLPHRAFNRAVGEYKDLWVSANGDVIDEFNWKGNYSDWLPDDDDHTYILSLMQPVTEPGKFASWIAEPKNGIAGKPGDYEYVKLAG